MDLTPEEHAQFDQIVAGLAALPSQAGLPARGGAPQGYVIKALLADSKPPIWRRFMVRSDASLAGVHAVIQAAFEWRDCHLYQFSFAPPFTPGAYTFVSESEFGEREKEVRAASFRLDEAMVGPGDRLNYVYDYGDNWGLRLTLEEVLELEGVSGGESPFATLLDGQRAAPPEVCGGVRDEDGLRALVGDPAFFDDEAVGHAVGAVALDGEVTCLESPTPRAANQSVLGPETQAVVSRISAFERIINYGDHEVGDDLVSRVTALYQDPGVVSAQDRAADLGLITWALEHLHGVKLTQAGYLPPKYVRELVSQVNSPFMRDTGVMTEVNYIEAAFFREALTKFGLLRKYRGELRRTTRGTAALRSPEALWQTLVTLLAPKNDLTFDDDARVFMLLTVASSHGEANLDLAAQFMTATGWEHDDGSAIEYHEVLFASGSPAPFLFFIGPQVGRKWAAKHVSASAVALARAALLG